MALQTTRNTLLAPKDALDCATSATSQTLDSAVVRSASTHHTTSKSLVAPDGGITLVPAKVCNSKAAQTASTPRNVRQCIANFGSSGAGLGGIGTNKGGVQEMLVMMSNHTHQINCCR